MSAFPPSQRRSTRRVRCSALRNPNVCALHQSHLPPPAPASLQDQDRLPYSCRWEKSAPHHGGAAAAPTPLGLLGFHRSLNTPPTADEGGASVGPPPLTQRESIWPAAQIAKQASLQGWIDLLLLISTHKKATRVSNGSAVDGTRLTFSWLRMPHFFEHNTQQACRATVKKKKKDTLCAGFVLCTSLEPTTNLFLMTPRHRDGKNEHR